MKRAALFGISLALATTAFAGRNMVQGVPWDAVPWETFCANVKPLRYTSPTQTCPTAHPAHSIWRKRTPQPKLRCEALDSRYKRYVKSVVGCKIAFASALRSRALFPEDYDEPLSTWRKRYFGPWMER